MASNEVTENESPPSFLLTTPSSKTIQFSNGLNGSIIVTSPNAKKFEVLKTILNERTVGLNIESPSSLNNREACTAAININNAKSEYYSNKNNLSRSLSTDNNQEDIFYLDNVLKAKDRRTSWQQLRSQKSYIPSLSAICKYIYLIYIFSPSRFSRI